MKLYNISGKALRVHILPLQSGYFSIDYKSKGCILPGLPLTIDISFHGSEPRKYSDWLKIVCPGEYNLMVPLEAAPASPYNIPRKIDLGLVPLGITVSHKFPIEPCPGTEVRFLIFLPAPSLDFTVQPTRGAVKDKDPPVNITITFRPTEYITVEFPIQLYIPHVSQSPFHIAVTAVSRPGLIRDRLLGNRQQAARSKLLKSTARPSGCKPTVAGFKTQKQIREMGDVAALNTVHDVARFLMSKDTKEGQLDTLPGPLNRTLEEDHAVWRVKEQEFRKEVEHYQAENNAAKVHHKDKLGQPIGVSSEMMEEVLAERTAQWEEYKSLLSSSTPNNLYTSTMGRCTLRRTVRDISKMVDPTFTNTPDDMWFVRYQTLCKFIQAARRVILQNRLKRRLQLLKNAREFVDAEEEKETLDEDKGEGPEVKGRERENETSVTFFKEIGK